jgi:flagellar biosynthesis/type III secretory pathway protein FliH
LTQQAEAQAMSDLTYPPVQQALKRLHDLSRNEQDRYRALARDKARYDELFLLNDAREEGRQEGRREGREEARQEAREEARKATLSRLLTRRFGPVPDWAAQRIQQATPTQLDAWVETILDAPTLEAVFHTSP